MAKSTKTSPIKQRVDEDKAETARAPSHDEIAVRASTKSIWLEGQRRGTT